MRVVPYRRVGIVRQGLRRILLHAHVADRAPALPALCAANVELLQDGIVCYVAETVISHEIRAVLPNLRVVFALQRLRNLERGDDKRGDIGRRGLAPC